MSLLALVLALLLEQFHPLGSRNQFFLLYTRFSNLIERKFNAGEYVHGVVGWLLAVVPACLIAWAVYAVLHRINPFLGLAWNVVILYLTMGFRHFSSAFSGISESLQQQDLHSARELLSGWTNQPTSEMTESEVSKVSIEQGLIDSHRYVFATIFWFLMLPGPIGAVLYRLSSRLFDKWGQRAERTDDLFGRFAATMHNLLDWIPIRLTAVSFAIVGDFEDAVYCWRAQAANWANYAYGILLASGAGAIGVRLGDPVHQDHTVKYRPELGVGDEADPDYLKSAVGLIWRGVLLWLLVVLLLSLSHAI
ncbi:CobD/CbiB family protein [Leeia sp. TBRC 13508]|uniref:Cobalamin biosynthesis protein CobD n=1 Tax=Leeia speluncae TaxID=2884804 RepID=A0ABS8D9C1_9NEIS|nr:CobD/CbiB family protein [Leeia speluncae]MCB6184809.1 CobD/CbiB family protein [Leeia speluncae]